MQMAIFGTMYIEERDSSSALQATKKEVRSENGGHVLPPAASASKVSFFRSGRGGWHL